jgi:predicted porin
VSDFTAAGNGTQLRLNYATGPVTLAYYHRSNSGEVHGTVDLGVAKISVGMDTKTSTVGADKRREFNVKIPMGGMEFGAFYGKKGEITSTEVGVTYALSKRTALNATTGSFKNAKQTDALDSSTRVRLTHSF